MFEALTFLLLARLLDPRSFGLVAFAAVFLSLLQLLVNQGFSRALVQRAELTKSHLDSSFLMSVVAGAGMTAVLVVLARPLAAAVDRPALAAVLGVLSLNLLVGALRSTPEALLTRRMAFRALAARSVTSSVLASVTGISLALSGAGVWALVGQALVETTTATVLVWVYSGWRPGVEWSRLAFTDLFGFSRRVLMVNLLNWVNRRSDDFLIGFFLGPAALGLYSVAYRLLLIMTDLLVAAVDRVAFPVFSRLQGDTQRLRNGYLSATQLSVSVAMPAFAMAAVLAPVLVPGLFGSQWTDAVPVMQVLCLIGALHSFLYFNSTVLMAVGKPQLVLRVTAANACINLIAFAVAVRYGINAVALAYVIRGYLMAPLPVWLTMRELEFSGGDLWRAVRGPLVSTALLVGAMLGVLAAMNRADVPSALVASVAGTVAFVSAMAIIERSKMQQIRRAFLEKVRCRNRAAAEPEHERIEAGSPLEGEKAL